jgi:hypothetical protein
MIAAMVPPAGFRSMAMMRACLVLGPAVGFDDAVRDPGFAVFRTVERAVALEPD